MKRRPTHRKLRRLVYIGCEGASEVSYAGFLQDLIRDAELDVHIHIEELGRGAGDPLSRIQLAVQRLERLRQTRKAPRERFVLLDFDQAEHSPKRAGQAQKYAADNAINIIWQRPCFEAMLLRHLTGKTTNRPPDTATAVQTLKKEWPEYRKPMTRANLARRIDRDAVQRAAAVEAELKALLRCIGIL